MASFIICCCTAFFLLINLIKYCYYCNRYRRYRYNNIYPPLPFEINYDYHLEDIKDDEDDILY